MIYFPFLNTLFGFVLGVAGTTINSFVIESKKEKQEKLVRNELWLGNHIDEILNASTDYYFSIRDTGINLMAIIKSPCNYDLTKESDHLLLFKKLYNRLLYFKNDKKIGENCETLLKEHEKFSLFNTKILTLSQKLRPEIKNPKNIDEIKEKIDKFENPLPENEALTNELYNIVNNIDKTLNQLEQIVIDKMPYKLLN